MTQTIGPSWSEDQKAEGEKMRQAWDEFFSTVETEKETHQQSPLNQEKAKIAEIRARHEGELLNYPNVIGVSEGIRMKGGKPTGEPCVTVLVRKKVPLKDLEKGDVIPREIEGISIDVVEVGELEAL